MKMNYNVNETGESFSISDPDFTATCTLCSASSVKRWWGDVQSFCTWWTLAIIIPLSSLPRSLLGVSRCWNSLPPYLFFQFTVIRIRTEFWCKLIRGRPLMIWGWGQRKYQTQFFFLAEAFLKDFSPDGWPLRFFPWRMVFDIFFSIFSAPPDH